MNEASNSRLFQILKDLHASCAPTDDGGDVDSSKGTLQLEVYALEIQMYGETKNNKKLRVSEPLARSSLDIDSLTVCSGNLRKESAS